MAFRLPVKTAFRALLVLAAFGCAHSPVSPPSPDEPAALQEGFRRAILRQFANQQPPRRITEVSVSVPESLAPGKYRVEYVVAYEEPSHEGETVAQSRAGRVTLEKNGGRWKAVEPTAT